jgi:hypothetical protein
MFLYTVHMLNGMHVWVPEKKKMCQNYQFPFNFMQLHEYDKLTYNIFYISDT